MLTRDEILSKNVLKREKVTVPEWGGDVFVSEMSGSSRDEFNFWLYETKKSGKIVFATERLICLTVVDDNGNRIFSESDMENLSKLSSVALDRVAEVAQRLNGLTDDAVEKAEKNSEAAPSGDSTSG